MKLQFWKPEPVVKALRNLMTEVGSTGLSQHWGQIDEEFLTELKGEKGREKYREMSTNDAVIGGLMFAIEMPIRRLTWTVTPGSDTGNDAEAIEFIESCLKDMSLSWSDFMAQVLSEIVYGWAYFEKVYKWRRGWAYDPSSRYNDNRLGWRKFAFRSQDTLSRWEFDDEGGIVGMVQRSAPDYRDVLIPIDKSVLFRTETYKNNPEGRSVLRTAYRPWYFKKNLEQIEGIALERMGAGYPVVNLPEGASAEDITLAKSIVRSVRVDEQMGLTIPAGFTFELMGPAEGSGVGEGFHRAILRYRSEMLMSVLASFIALGTEKVGSYALSADQRDFFQIGVEGWVSSIADTINRFALPELLQINGFAMDEMPELTYSGLADISTTGISDYFSKLTSAGLINYDAELENWLRRKVQAPEMPDEMSAYQQDTQAVQEARTFANTLDGDKKDEALKVVEKLASAVERGYVRTPAGVVNLYKGADHGA